MNLTEEDFGNFEKCEGLILGEHGCVCSFGGGKPFKDFYFNSVCKDEIIILFEYFWVL